MNLNPEECRILLTEPPLNPLSNRKRMFEVMFENYKFHSAYLAIQAVLTLYAAGTYIQGPSQILPRIFVHRSRHRSRIR